MALLQQLQGLIGISAILAMAWGLSEQRKAFPGWRWVGGALLLQILIALVIVRVPFVWDIIMLANYAVMAIEKATLVGSSYMFGYTGGGETPYPPTRREASACFAFHSSASREG